jgi:AGZA family xanthine/uracil permease-like MFS transporter
MAMRIAPILAYDRARLATSTAVTPPRTGAPPAYRWAAPGDLNAFFGLMLDNVMNLVILAGILIGVFGFPRDLVYTKMFPGTALGVLFGDLVYTWMAFRLARREGRSDVTAMPLGLDAPSTIGMAFAVLGPAFLSAKTRMPEAEAGVFAWQVGMACMVLIGLFKLGMSFVGGAIQRVVPKAGLLGSIAGVGIALMGVLQLADILAEPVVGFVSLGLIFYSLIARLRLPFGIPGVVASVGAGAVVHYVLGGLGLLHRPLALPPLEFPIGFPVPTLGFIAGMPTALSQYLPVAIPFAILTVIGGINVNESARLAGDTYRTRSILLTEAVATLVAGVCGGVSQTTPYIGHPAYKNMGGRAAYTLATGVFVGLGGILGYIPFLAMLLPISCLAPILIFVAFDIVGQAFHETLTEHGAAVCFATFPSVAQLVLITLDKINPLLASSALEPVRVAETLKLAPTFVEGFGVFVLLAHGFILTAMLWGAALAFLIEHRVRASAVVLAIAATFSLFGLIHSALPTGGVYLPWSQALLGSHVPYHWAAGYAALAVLFLVLGPRGHPRGGTRSGG